MAERTASAREMISKVWDVSNNWLAGLVTAIFLVGNSLYLIALSIRPTFVKFGHPFELPQVWWLWIALTLVYAVYGAGVVLVKGDLGFVPTKWTRHPRSDAIGNTIFLGFLVVIACCLTVSIVVSAFGG
jgi:threonine/homoserine/homoserine lactone efflux protein